MPVLLCLAMDDSTDCKGRLTERRASGLEGAEVCPESPAIAVNRAIR
jgi:hypothetical protein